MPQVVPHGSQLGAAGKRIRGVGVPHTVRRRPAQLLGQRGADDRMLLQRREDRSFGQVRDLRSSASDRCRHAAGPVNVQDIDAGRPIPGFERSNERVELHERPRCGIRIGQLLGEQRPAQSPQTAKFIEDQSIRRQPEDLEVEVTVGGRGTLGRHHRRRTRPPAMVTVDMVSGSSMSV